MTLPDHLHLRRSLAGLPVARAMQFTQAINFSHLKRGISQQQQVYPILKEIADRQHFTRVDLAPRCNQVTPDKSTI